MILRLDGSWELRQDGADERIAAQVPGCVHTDLLAAGKIEDPFVGMNEADLRWIFQRDWIYQRTFEVDADFLAQPRLLLCCEGLDTVAQITLNGQLLGTADNMFRRWEFDAKPFLHAGRNHIEIRFNSPVKYIEARQAIRPMNYPTAKHQVAAFSQIRKAAFSFGWDWGPCLPTSGIWRPIYLQAVGAGRLHDVSIRQNHADPQRVGLAIDVQAESGTARMISARVHLKFDGKLIDQGTCQISESGNTESIHLVVDNPQLWWPRGMGEQPLYDVSVELLDENSRVFDQWARRIGLRTLTLDLSPDQWGNTFSFRANGVPFFAKGTNWVPADALLTRVATKDYRRLLTAAADVHMNMIRVWGGGIYEPDVFYDLCDELGLCVWQDFMFACAPYPLNDPEFVENSLIEARQQIQRLRHHACLALWCGNNELEMCGFVATQGDDGHMSREDYQSFFERKIPSLVATHSPEHSYWPGSPYKEAGEAYNPDAWIDSPGRGDVHNWSVWHMKKPFEYYQECYHRFISEFGLQSYPEPTSVRRFAEAVNQGIKSPAMLHHQRNGDGNDRIAWYLQEWFRLPKDFEATLWCSQIQQGLAMKIACEHWRHNIPRTMGTLIWQLNDAWPAASWSGIDYFGQWKAMHYMARRFYAPLLISATEEAGHVQLRATSDARQPEECVLIWKLFDLQGHELKRHETTVSLQPQTSQIVAELDCSKDVAQYGAENLLLWVSLAQGGESVSSDLILFTKPKNLALPDPELTYTLSDFAEDSVLLTLTTQKPALWAWIEAPGLAVHCSDNFFHLEPRVPTAIRVEPASRTVTPSLTQALRVRSLFDTYSTPA